MHRDTQADKDALLARLNLTLMQAVGMAERMTERVRELEAALEAVTRERDALRSAGDDLFDLCTGEEMHGYDALAVWRSETRGEGSGDGT